MKIPKEKIQEIFKLSTLWLYETLAFILLPLLIYLILYFSFSNSIYDFARLPEWMFITIVLYGDTVRKLILLYLKFKNPELRIARTIAQAVIAIVLTSSFLTILLIAQQEHLEISPFIYWGQFIIFFHSIWFSYSTSIRASLMNDDGKKITKLDIFNKDKEKAWPVTLSWNSFWYGCNKNVRTMINEWLNENYDWECMRNQRVSENHTNQSLR